MKNLFIIMISFFILNIIYGQTGPEKIVDRIILKINKLPYTQREMEVYFLLLGHLKKDDKEIVTAFNWQEKLQKFKQKMLIFEEVRRFYKHGNNEVEKVEELFFDIKSKKSLSSFVARLKVQKQDVALAYVRYRAIKQGESQLNTSFRDVRFNSKEAEKKTMKLLEKKFEFRFYDDSFTYKEIYLQSFLKNFSTP